MEPLDIKNFEHHCTEWSNNNNVGVEYEFALYYLLLDVRFRDIFNNLTINNHAKKEKILRIIDAQKANIYQQISKYQNQNIQHINMYIWQHKTIPLVLLISYSMRMKMEQEM